MALRVLLADESSTIKKVFQLALQDFAVEVRPVNVGVDVAPVARNFQPDIIFADVLLQKRSGYDVAAEIKQDAALKQIPVVLMWSGFMELDEDKFQACMANAQLEKPFDVAALRKLVNDLVPRTHEQRISQFLSFPKMPDIELGGGPSGGPSATPSSKQSGGGAFPPPPPAEAVTEDFAQVPLPKIKGPQGEKYRLNLKPEEMDPAHVPVAFDVPEEKSRLDDILKPLETEEEPFAIKETKRTAKPKSPPAPARAALPPQEDLELEPEAVDLVTDADLDEVPAAKPPLAGGLSAEALEQIVRQQSAEVIESVVWKVVPDLAAQIIERELNKLLKERESNPY